MLALLSTCKAFQNFRNQFLYPIFITIISFSNIAPPPPHPSRASYMPLSSSTSSFICLSNTHTSSRDPKCTCLPWQNTCIQTLMSFSRGSRCVLGDGLITRRCSKPVIQQSRMGFSGVAPLVRREGQILGNLSPTATALSCLPQSTQLAC